MEDSDLLALAKKIREQAYAPYSNFSVGAVLVGENEKRYCGCNVENVSFGLTICAERNALAAAIADGCRQFSKIVIVADCREPVPPCGGCRQVLAEFAPNLAIVSANLHGEV